ncbi:hypothetical protein [Pseudoxanthomonas sacheonensis]|uniref:Uncharacterized protein n=1 Tax=Pseudoxanthomonas sacheonensis TaxID=443615 RepID=A0ABU1RWQ3_9GAMM|nr:hypothetical protein [Pseudoxanthomonas sacheonensis]MDR6843042.1 hypothetical protein [Pseudoxanthomonas sacheonensis]
MVPYGLNQEQFVSMYQRKLDRLSDQVISALRDLLAVPLGHGIDEAHLEVFPDDYGGAPSIWAYWRGKNNKVDHGDQSLFPGRSLELDLDLRDLAEIDEQYFVEPDKFPGLQLTADLLSRWLAESWWKAGGWTYPVPVTLAVHDFGSYGWVQLSKGGT